MTYPLTGLRNPTPAREAGVSDHVWDIEEIAALLPRPTLGPRGPYKKKNSN
jgi:hypothetical protein